MGALEGIRVVDVGLLVQGPQAGQTLRDLGAEVIKVELPGLGDMARWIPISMEDLRTPYFEACNRGKKSITIDLRVTEGANIFRKLVDTADVLVANFKPGTLEAWGLSYEELSKTNPGLIYAMGSTFGPEGKGADREGADLAGQAAGGLISTTGSDGEPPTPVGATIADHIGSMNMTVGILAALFSRNVTGKGQRVDVSLLGGQIYAQASEYTAYLMTEKVPGRSNGGHPLLPMAYGILETADGHIALVGVLPDKRQALYEAAGVPELIEDERFAPIIYTTEIRQELFRLLSDGFKAKTTDEWAAILDRIEVRYAPVNDYAQAASDPLVTTNNYIVELEDVNGETRRVVGSPIKMSDTPTSPSASAPELGQHTEEVLLELGYTWEQIGELRDLQAI
ncbi:MAG: carnitine dehydratase [Acidimicrobiaceae bacterium]|nr:carnitine dehydratase [Acidimicrobiaceae bacterium]|tara:strand:- start:127 stop:1314 length:1188 start_codon:yes stop_codon:yes gene_type:complete